MRVGVGLGHEIGVGVGVDVDFGCGEVDEFFGVEWIAKKTKFEVKMWTSRATRAAPETNRCASHDSVASFDQSAREVCHHRFETVVVANNQIAAIASALVCHITHYAREWSADCVAMLYAYVDTTMESSTTNAKTRSDALTYCRIAIVGTSDVDRIGKRVERDFVGIDKSRIFVVERELSIKIVVACFVVNRMLGFDRCV